MTTYDGKTRINVDSGWGNFQIQFDDLTANDVIAVCAVVANILTLKDNAHIDTSNTLLLLQRDPATGRFKKREVA